MQKKVLIIDDDPELGKLVQFVLNPIDLAVYQAFSGSEGLKTSYDIHPDLVILDVMMPGMDGYDVCRSLREMTSVPILMLTARTSEQDVLRGFTVGVDDFVKKPFSRNELEARVRALLRRAGNHNGDAAMYIMSYEDSVLEIDMTTQTVKLFGEIVELSPREYNLLACLVREQGRVVSRRELTQAVWGDPSAYNMSNSSLYVFYLRKKIQDEQHGHKYINTLSGRGYWFKPRVEEAT